ncbi:MAG: flagellar basal body L-ring protein FlgH [Myxococcaceae bacterium]|nr:flagellar basal body L-ring protein FlgH [Myxococcaceae bacterium]
MSRPLALTCALLAAGCGPAHIAKYEPKHRTYELGAAGAVDAQPQQPGSLFHPGQSAAMLFTDARALHQNDLVVVKVEELADSQRRADTDLKHASKVSADLSLFLQVAGVKGTDLEAGTAGQLGTEFQGLGSTRRTEHLVATVPALVKQVLPNGNLFVEGHRVVLVNQEEHHFYISGVVRPIDIDQQNSVKSSLLADAEVEFTASGNLTDNQRQGVLGRFLTWIWPF